MQGWDDDENRQKVVAEGKLQKAASADQHDMGKLQQGQQQQQHHMVAVWVLTTAASQNFQKLCRCRVVPIELLSYSALQAFIEKYV